ncbi:hypothetical protein [Cryobacterium sp. GrIS_2_6]|uniref:hypothetical protein n=1 Tax=Cryobacterium sp. GrIS_2_6 TaxID=3162785 RepID=UPI002DFD587C|nr:hypothetical protein [Cryobacterium psychrotolerans]
MNIVAHFTTSEIAANGEANFDAATSVGRYSDRLSHRFLPGAIGTLREPRREPITIRPPRRHAHRVHVSPELKGGTNR